MPSVTTVAVDGMDDPRILQAYESNKQPYASCDGSVQLLRNGSQQFLTQPRSGKREEENSRKEDGAQGSLPGHAHAFHNGVGKVSIQPHARSERERQVGNGAHQDRSKGCAQAGRDGDGRKRHARFVQNGRIHKNDVSHCDERSQSGETFGAPVSLIFFKTKVSFEGLSHAVGTAHV